MTQLEDLERRKAEEAREKAEKDDNMIGRVFKVHRAQLGLLKLKKYLKQGTTSQTYEKLLLPPSLS